jgi:hypothetical protein
MGQVQIPVKITNSCYAHCFFKKPHGVGVQSEALFGRMALEFKAKLCLAAQSFALNSNVPTMRYFKNNKLHPHF